MTDAVAGSLLDEAIAIERDRAGLLTSYRPKFAAVLPATKVARYYQIENKIRAAINYEFARAIPDHVAGQKDQLIDSVVPKSLLAAVSDGGLLS